MVSEDDDFALHSHLILAMKIINLQTKHNVINRDSLSKLPSRWEHGPFMIGS